MKSLQKRNDDDDVVEVKKDRASKKEKRTEEEKELRKEKKQIKKRVSCKLTHTSCRLTLNWLKDRDEVPAVEKRRKDEDKTIKISHHNGEDEERQRRYVRMSDVRIWWEAVGLLTNNIFALPRIHETSIAIATKGITRSHGLAATLTEFALCCIAETFFLSLVMLKFEGFPDKLTYSHVWSPFILSVHERNFHGDNCSSLPKPSQINFAKSAERVSRQQRPARDERFLVVSKKRKIKKFW